MLRVMLASLVVVFVITATAFATSATSDTAAPPATRLQLPDIPSLIDRLADPDPSLRTDAFNRLSALAQFARPQLMEAMDSAGPEVRSQISRILLHRPWVDSGDPEIVKVLMSNYSEQSVESRRQIIAKLAQVSKGDADMASLLLRITQNDPSPAVRWDAAEVLRVIPTTKAFQDHVRSLPDGEIGDNIPLLSVCGWAWRDVDPQRTRDLLSKAVSLEAVHPSAVNGQLDFAYIWLIQLATDDQRYSDAIVLLREQASRTPWDPVNIPVPIANLIAFQAEYGPFPGFLRDLQTYNSYFNQPQMIYSIGRFLQRQDHPVLALSLDTIALLDGGLSSDAHCQTGGFLIDQGWEIAARCELQVSLWVSHDNEAVNTYFQLARLAGDEGDELATAVNLEAALTHAAGMQMQRTTRFGEVLPWSDDEAWAEVHWHYLRAARAANDIAAVQTHLEKLMELNRLGQILQKDPSLATDIVPALNDTGRTEDAKKCFEAAYKNLKDSVTADPTDIEAKNNLAWLCARCNERVDEAVKLADQTVMAAPTTSAYLDTDAEAHFRAGDRNKAVELETKALELKPNDSFMKAQLKRFQLGEKSSN